MALRAGGTKGDKDTPGGGDSCSGLGGRFQGTAVSSFPLGLSLEVAARGSALPGWHFGDSPSLLAQRGELGPKSCRVGPEQGWLGQDLQSWSLLVSLALRLLQRLGWGEARSCL